MGCLRFRPCEPLSIKPFMLFSAISRGRLLLASFRGPTLNLLSRVDGAATAPKIANGEKNCARDCGQRNAIFRSHNNLSFGLCEPRFCGASQVSRCLARWARQPLAVFFANKNLLRDGLSSHQSLSAVNHPRIFSLSSGCIRLMASSEWT